MELGFSGVVCPRDILLLLSLLFFKLFELRFGLTRLSCILCFLLDLIHDLLNNFSLFFLKVYDLSIQLLDLRVHFFLIQL
jgi:hypothetical protein